jgi:ribose transport system substrate-binding protein
VSRRFLRIRISTIAAGLVLSLAVAACGGSSTSPTSSASGPASASSGSSSGNINQIQARVAALYRGIDIKSPPTTSPPPAKGKNVWVLSCSQAVDDCSRTAAAQVQAAKAMGWHVTLFDTKFQPALMAQGFQQAIAAHADGIVTYGLDCDLVRSSLLAAKKAGVLTVGAELGPCKQPLYSWIDTYSVGNVDQFENAVGAGQADLMIAHTQGHANIIELREIDSPIVLAITGGFEQEIKAKCPGCKILTVLPVTASEIGPPLQQKVQQALVQYPQADAMNIPFDGLYEGGAGPALLASGRAHKVFVSLGEGEAPVMAALRGGQIDGAGIARPNEWDGYGTVDALNRLFNHQKPVSTGIGLQAYDATRNMPSSGQYKAPMDFQSIYMKAWGLG